MDPAGLSVKILDEIPVRDIISRIKMTPLLHDSSVMPYKNSDVSIRPFNIDQLCPTSFYVLNEGLQRQRLLRKAMISQFNIDTFSLDRGYVIETADGIHTLTPVITHLSEIDGNVVLLEDGVHRTYHGIEQRQKQISVIYIKGVPIHIPFDVLPNPNGWDDVNVFDNIRDVPLKKLYRHSDKDKQYKLYRNYDIHFPGIGAPRKI